MKPIKTTTSFRFEAEFIDLLNTWSFVTKKEKNLLIQEAFREYTKMKKNEYFAGQVKSVIESMTTWDERQSNSRNDNSS